MSKNTVFGPTRTRSLPVPDGTLSGAPIMVGSLVGVALTDEGKGGNADNFATLALDGAHKLPVSTTTALTVGAPVYYVTSTKLLSTTSNSGANPLFGYALTAKGTTAGEVITVELAQV